MLIYRNCLCFGLLLILSIHNQAYQQPVEEHLSDIHASVDNDLLDKLAIQYDEDQLKHDPISATYRGDHRFNDQLGLNIDEQSRLDQGVRFDDYQNQLHAIDRSRLTTQRQMTYDIIGYACKMELESLHRHFSAARDMMPMNQLFSLPLTLATLGSGCNQQPFKTVADYDNWMKRAGQFPDWVDQAIANMNNGIKKDIVMPRIIVDRIIPQIKPFTDGAVEASIFWQPIAQIPNTFDPSDKERLQIDYRNLIQHQLIPAYTRLYHYLSDVYAAKARETVGLEALPAGKEWYRFLTRFYTTTNMSPVSIHEAGKKQVSRIFHDIERVKNTLGFKGDMKAFFDYLKSDPQFFYTSPEALIARYNELKLRVYPELTRLFNKLPDVDFVIKPIEAFREKSAPPAMYQPASADNEVPGIFYINTDNLPSRHSYLSAPLFLHEASPGHHFQISITMEQKDLPTFRQFPIDYAYAEGWALYAEFLGQDLNLYNDPYDYLGSLILAIWRANRLVVDTGIHFYGWDRQKAIDWMSTHSSLDEHDIAIEVDRYIGMPGQALSYMVGCMTIQALRSEAEITLGEQFDIKAFHDQILNNGSLPLDVLQKNVRLWINKANRNDIGKTVLLPETS